MASKAPKFQNKKTCSKTEQAPSDRTVGLVYKAKKEWELTVDALPDLIALLDADLHIVRVNKSLASRLDVTPAQAVGMEFTRIVPACPEPAAFENEQAGLKEHHLFDEELGGHFEVTCSPVFNENTLEYIVFIGRDVNERYRLKRMKSDLISIVSHELRTPLTAIQGALGLLKGGALGEIPKNIAAIVQIAYHNTERLIRLVNDLLDIKKIEEGQLRLNLAPVDMTPLVRHSVEEMTPFAEKFGIRLRFADPMEKTLVYADADKLVQVLTNLLSNAIKFSPRDDVVTVSVYHIEGTIRVSVADNGPGIPESFRDYVFDQFSQAESVKNRGVNSSGLGLSIAKAIVEKHGGRIHFTTSTGKGTTFHVDLKAME
ncbi:MAG: ATP-binding protein [Desulfovibrio sp.]|uniref:sensor histidine kinase n=1 Tax=Desulfovibrio sp. 7SRBS1 TaxID=3378064 RepID=UPI003B41A360